MESKHITSYVAFKDGCFGRLCSCIDTKETSRYNSNLPKSRIIANVICNRCEESPQIWATEVEGMLVETLSMAIRIETKIKSAEQALNEAAIARD